MGNPFRNLYAKIRDFTLESFDAQPQGDQQPETKPVVEKSELELLQDAKERLELEFVNLHKECFKQRSRIIKAESRMYPLQEFTKYVREIESQYFERLMKVCNEIETRYRDELNQYNQEADKLYKEIIACSEHDHTRQQKHKEHDEACDRYIALSKLMCNKQKEEDKNLLKQYPYKMLQQMLTTAIRDFELRRKEISEEVMEEFKDDKHELLLKIEVIKAKISRINNPEPEVQIESPFQAGEDMHDFTEQLTYEADSPDNT
jgi:hypothetical protein